MNQPKWLFVLLLSSTLVACGGSSSSDDPSPSSSSSSSTSSSTSSSDPASSSSSSISSSSSSSSSSEPTPTAFVCPETGLYFCDDFADGTADKWFLLSSPDNPEGEPDGTFDVVNDNGNNVLRFTAGSLGGELALIDSNAMDIPSADYYVEARIRPRENSSTSNKFLFLMARYQSEGNWYAGGLNVQNSTDNTKVEIAKSVGGSINRPVQAGYEIVQGAAGELDGQWYTVRFELIGDTLTVYFNGEEVGSTTDGDYTSIGDIGLFTYNKSFEIDDVVIGDPANKPVQLTIDPPSNEWVAEAETDDYVVNVTAVQSNGDPDTFSVESSNPSVVGVSTNGNQVSLSPLAEGEATITFTSGSEATLTRTINATITPAFVQPDAVYDLGDRTLPAVGGTDILSDTRIKLTFDDVPTLGSAGSARLYKASDDTAVDNISVAGETVSMPAADRDRTISADQIWVEGNTVVIAPHAGVLEAATEYYVAIADGVIEGTLNGAEFTGLGKDAGWSFTTRVDAPSGTEVTVAETGEADFRTVQGALTYAMLELGKDDAATINIMNGTYREPLYLRNKNNLTLRGESRDGTVIQFTNNNVMNPGTSERALFLVESADMLVLEDLTIENTTLIGEGGQAETIYFNSPYRLVAKNAAFISEQDTLLLKGYSWFYQSLVAGNVDYIWGTADVALFEDSEIRTLGRSDGGSGGYILQARTADSVKGFVFLNSELTRGEGSAGHTVADDTYALARSGGSSTYYDNVVFVNTKMDDHIRPEGWHTNPTPNPATATATNGWREYNSMDLSGTPIDTSSWVSYQLSEAEYEAEFCNRAQIFSTYGTGGWDPFPEDTTDDSCTTVEEPTEVWSGSGLFIGDPAQSTATTASGSIDAQAEDGSSVTFTASDGKFESYAQSFYLVSQEVTGDFALTAKLKSVGAPYPANQFPVGLMMCECDTASGATSPLATSGTHMDGSAWVPAYARVLEDGAFWGKVSYTDNPVTPGDNFYLKLERADNKYLTSYSTDGGVTYVTMQNGTFSDTNLPDTMNVGFFAAPYYSDQSFTFEDIQLVQ